MDMSSRNSILYYWLSAALGFVIFLIVGIKKWRSNRLSPGPFALPLLGHLHLLEPNVHECLSKIPQRHGPLMSMKRYQLCTSTETGGRGMEFKDLVGELVYVLGVPNASDLFPFLERLDVQGLYRRMQKVFVRFDKLFDSIIQDRVRGKSKGQDFL
ncbi:hypothetical protein SUGI_0590150 [Cryptomeria japonica]|nr:hypothetical protein SUGI_0590150 [Cryptomeria japonica]